MSESTISVFELQQSARLQLRQAGIDTAALDARVLLCHVCGLSETELIAYPEKKIEWPLAEKFHAVIQQRARRKPLAYLTGMREFWGLDFFVNEQTLIPRPESEFAVELAVDQTRSICRGSGHARVLDLGTGTGCLIISILHEVEQASGIGVDINAKAVELAKKNASALGVNDRAIFLCMNWAEKLDETFDIVVSNPPYIATAGLHDLMPEVAKHEPFRALDGGFDGLEEYRKIISQVSRVLKSNGVVVFEIGDGQGQDVLALLKTNGFLPCDANQPIGCDLAGRQRIIGAVKAC